MVEHASSCSSRKESTTLSNAAVLATSTPRAEYSAHPSHNWPSLRTQSASLASKKKHSSLTRVQKSPCVGSRHRTCNSLRALREAAAEDGRRESTGITRTSTPITTIGPGLARHLRRSRCARSQAWIFSAAFAARRSLWRLARSCANAMRSCLLTPTLTVAASIGKACGNRGLQSVDLIPDVPAWRVGEHPPATQWHSPPSSSRASPSSIALKTFHTPCGSSVATKSIIKASGRYRGPLKCDSRDGAPSSA